MAERELMFFIPRLLLGLEAEPLAVEFHWSDNLQNPGDESAFLTNGDSAPPRRFNYRYSTES